MRRLTAVGFLGLLSLSLVMACGRAQFAGNPEAAQPTAASDSASEPAPFSKAEAEGAPAPERSSLLSSKLAPANLTVPAGTPVAVRLQANVSSASARSGEQFDAVLEEPLVISGKTVAAKGTPVVGRVVAARSSGRLHNPGYLRLTLASIEIAGKQTPVQTSSVFAAGASHKKRNLAWIGGSTGAGALIGGIAGGGKGALIGSAIGATGGTTAAYATGKKDVGFAAERRLTFRLLQPLTVHG